MALSLAERLTSARKSPTVRIADLESLIAEAAAERERLLSASIAANTESVDFALSDDDRDAAAACAERYARTARGLESVTAELQVKLADKRESDAQKARQAVQAAALAERDQVAERIAKEWPAITAQSVALFKAINASNDKLKAAGLNDPCAESMARCGGKHFPLQAKRLTQMRLAGLAAGEEAWPPPPPPLGAGFNYGAAIEQARQQREAQAVAEAKRAQEQAQLHGIYRLSSMVSITSAVSGPLRLPADIADQNRVPRGLYYGDPWEGRLPHTVAEKLRSVEHLKVERLDTEAVK